MLKNVGRMKRVKAFSMNADRGQALSFVSFVSDVLGVVTTLTPITLGDRRGGALGASEICALIL